jgi:virginiamycin B lyase
MSTIALALLDSDPAQQIALWMCSSQCVHWEEVLVMRVSLHRQGSGRQAPCSADHPPQGAEIDPHTPVFDHNGIVWFTNEETNYIGRLDPSTGQMTLAKSPTAHAVPYGIVVTKDDVPFFCEFGTNKLASIDPSTMKIREYTLPAANARPRRIALAPDGTIYYTDYARGYLGHFDPASGKLLKEWASPGGTGSEPYGIAVTKEGEVWYSESGVKPNTL